MSHNLFQFIGNLTHDTENSPTTTGTSRAFLNIAVHRVWIDAQSNEKREAVDYFRIKLFSKFADNALKFLGKGSQVFVSGRIEPTRWEDEGETRYGFDFIAGEIQYLATKEPSPPATSAKAA